MVKLRVCKLCMFLQAREITYIIPVTEATVSIYGRRYSNQGEFLVATAANDQLSFC